MDQTSNGTPRTVKPPLGIFQAKCDEKGRLKLPSEVATYLKTLGVERVFITTVDLKLIRIYSETLWESNQNLFESAGDSAEIAQDVAFIANHYGAYSEMDESGRVLIPTVLRRELEVEGQPVWLDFFNGRINVFGKKVFDERMQRALAHLPEKVLALEKKGFK